MQVDYQGPVIGIAGPHMMVIHASRVTKAHVVNWHVKLVRTYCESCMGAHSSVIDSSQDNHSTFCGGVPHSTTALFCCLILWCKDSCSNCIQ